jgi:hypothetical protein
MRRRLAGTSRAPKGPASPGTKVRGLATRGSMSFVVESTEVAVAYLTLKLTPPR